MGSLRADRHPAGAGVDLPSEAAGRIPRERRLAGRPAPSPAEAREGLRNARRRLESPAVLALMSGLAVAWFWPALSSPVTHSVGGGGDSYAVMWYLGWFPFAIGHGMNPLVSPYVWAPRGINLMWNPMPLLALVLSPVTVTAGAVASFNLVTTAAPALSAWVAYLAFRRWTKVVPALVGALLFGFSPFIAAESFQHPFLTFSVTAPLLLVVSDRMLVVQRAPAWRDGLWLGLLVWVQLLVSEEILVIEAVAAVVGVATLCLANRRAVASRLRHALVAVGVGAATSVVLSAAPLAYQFLGPDRLSGRVHPQGIYVTDLWNFVVPTRVTALSPSWARSLASHFTGNYTAWEAYVGVPLLAFVVVAMVACRRRRVAWVGCVVAAAAAVLSLGNVLHVAGASTGIPLPWDLVSRLPLLQDVLPGRFSAVMFLGVGLVVALGLDELWRHRPAPRAAAYGLAAAGLAAIAPIVPYPANAVPVSAAFARGSVCPRQPGADVAVEPSQAEATLFWQVEAGFCFSMPTGSGLIQARMRPPSAWGALTDASLAAEAGQPLPVPTPSLRAGLQAQLDAARTTAIVLGPALPSDPPQARDDLAVWLTDLLDAPPVEVGDTLVWRAPGTGTLRVPPPTPTAQGGAAPTPPAPAGAPTMRGVPSSAPPPPPGPNERAGSG
ncbi:MAG: hypothetical protein ACRDZQ_11795, partial [Acidimicrobiales bacterium]